MTVIQSIIDRSNMSGSSYARASGLNSRSSGPPAAPATSTWLTLALNVNADAAGFPLQRGPGGPANSPPRGHGEGTQLPFPLPDGHEPAAPHTSCTRLPLARENGAPRKGSHVSGHAPSLPGFCYLRRPIPYAGSWTVTLSSQPRAHLPVTSQVRGTTCSGL